MTSMKKLDSPNVAGVAIDQSSIVECENHRPIRNTKLYGRNNPEVDGHDKIVTIGNRLKKILRKIPPEIGMGKPAVAVAERPGRIPDRRGAIFSYTARDLRNQRKKAMAITKSDKDDNWYTAANDYLIATSSGITPTWE